MAVYECTKIAGCEFKEVVGDEEKGSKLCLHPGVIDGTVDCHYAERIDDEEDLVPA